MKQHFNKGKKKMQLEFFTSFSQKCKCNEKEEEIVLFFCHLKENNFNF